MAKARTVLAAFKPNAAALGYALFLAVNATVVWGGVFPFLPYSIQSSETMLWFFIVEATVFAAAFLASIFGAYAFPKHTKRFLVPLASLPYALGWVCLIAASYAHGISSQLVVTAGALLGVGSAGFYMLWQRLFAAKRPGRGTHDLVLGTVYASVIYFGLHAIPEAVTALLVPLVFLPLFGLAIILSSRRVDVGQPMFEDVPKEHPQVYRRVVSDVWRSAVSLGGFGLCTGVMRAVAITDPAIGATVNIVSMMASFVVAAVLLVLWQHRSIALNIPLAYRRSFPVVLAAFLLMPVVPGEYVIWLAAILYALHGAAILLMMIQCAQISRDRGINPVFIYGLFGGIMYALHDLGFIMGSVASVAADPALSSPAMIALASVCALSLLALVGTTPRRNVESMTDGNSIELLHQPSMPDDRSVELAEKAVALDEEQERTAALDAKPAGEGVPAAQARQDAPYYVDRLSKQVELMRIDYGLSAREAEVAELLARGETVARIAETLYVSENTVRTHSKRIYAKLDVHKKQQLRDLVESYDPGALS